MGPAEGLKVTPFSMVAESTLQSLQLVVVGKGGRPTGGEGALVDLCRLRLKAELANESPSGLRLQFIHGVEPLVQYLKAALPENDYSALQSQGFDDAVFELYKVVAARTKFVRRYAPIVDSEEEWAKVAKALLSISRGHTVAPPQSLYARAAATRGKWRPPSQSWFCMRSRRWTAFWLAGLGVSLMYAMELLNEWQLVATGRTRLVGAACGLLLVLSGSWWWLSGPEVWELPACLASPESQNDDDAHDAQV